MAKDHRNGGEYARLECKTCGHTGEVREYRRDGFNPALLSDRARHVGACKGGEVWINLYTYDSGMMRHTKADTDSGRI